MYIYKNITYIRFSTIPSLGIHWSSQNVYPAEKGGTTECVE